MNSTAPWWPAACTETSWGYTTCLTPLCLALGANSISDNWTAYTPNEKTIEAYQQRIAAGELPHPEKTPTEPGKSTAVSPHPEHHVQLPHELGRRTNELPGPVRRPGPAGRTDSPPASGQADFTCATSPWRSMHTTGPDSRTSNFSAKPFEGGVSISFIRKSYLPPRKP